MIVHKKIPPVGILMDQTPGIPIHWQLADLLNSFPVQLADLLIALGNKGFHLMMDRIVPVRAFPVRIGGFIGRCQLMHAPDLVSIFSQEPIRPIRSPMGFTTGFLESGDQEKTIHSIFQALHPLTLDRAQGLGNTYSVIVKIIDPVQLRLDPIGIPADAVGDPQDSRPCRTLEFIDVIFKTIQRLNSSFVNSAGFQCLIENGFRITLPNSFFHLSSLSFRGQQRRLSSPQGDQSRWDQQAHK